MPIKEMEIHQWADHHECRSQLPILIRRLIRETNPTVSLLRFPGNEAVDLAGLDGQVEATAPTRMVPQGHSIWEMGCNQNPKAKADEDYAKRTAETPNEERATSTFVFVTPRRWNGKSSWLAERRQEKSWAGIFAYDAIDLETWLEEAPVASRWLGEILGIDSPGLLTPCEWWQRWATVTEPPLPKRLLTTRRHNERQTLLDQLRRNEPIVTVLADDRQEAVAFVVATLLETECESGANELLDRTLVATSAMARIAYCSNRLIIIADVAEEADPDFGDRRNITIVRTYPKGSLNADDALLLSHVPAEIFRTELESMGFSQDEASRKALQTGHSVPVLRRHLSRDPAIRQPAWARSRASAKRLLPFALAGTWVEKSSFDDSTFIELLGELTSQDVERVRDDLLALNDAPIAQYGNVTKVVSQLDALFAVGPFIEKGDLDRFFQLAEELLGERDPALDIPQEQWWMAHALGKVPSCSEGLLAGLGDALCILAVNGAAICGDRLRVDCAYRVGRVVHSLMHNASEERWLTIRGRLRALAEAAPHVFLDCLEEELQKPDPPIRAIMGTTGGGLTGDCLRTGLLWALEILAWHPEHFSRVVQIIFWLCSFDVNDNWTNTPKATAKALFRAWLPATSLSVVQRTTILRTFAERYRAPVIDVCLSLLPSSFSRVASKTAQPAWRALEVEVLKPTNADVQHAAVEASRLLLDLTPFVKMELKILLESVTRLHPDDLNRLVCEVQRWAVDANDEEKAELQNDVRRYDTWRSHQKDNDATQEIAFQQIKAVLEPAMLTARHRWLFESAYIEWRTLVEEDDEGRLSYEDRNARVLQRRQEAIAEIEAHLGTEQVLQFALDVKHPELVAQILAPHDASPADTGEWIDRILARPSSEAADTFLRQLLWSAGWSDLPAVVAWLHENAVLDTSDKQLRFAKHLPGFAVGWRVAESMGGEFADAYWNAVSVSIGTDTPAEEVIFAIEKLMAVQRPRSAFSVVQYFPDRIAPEQWVHILQAIAHGEESEGPMPDAYHIDEILEHLETTKSITDEKLVQLELPYLLRICPYGHRNHKRTLAVHRELVRDPTLFVQLLSWRYRRKDKAEEPELEDMHEEQRKFMKDIAFSVFEGWNQIPGCHDNGNIDREAFLAWVETALHSATEMSRREVAEALLGEMLGRFVQQRSWDDWLPECVLDFLDRPENGGLREHFDLGVRNARGTTMRSPFDGGAQERQLANNYRELATRYSITHPRVSAPLTSLAKGYEWDASREDDEAAINERWHL